MLCFIPRFGLESEEDRTMSRQSRDTEFSRILQEHMRQNPEAYKSRTGAIMYTDAFYEKGGYLKTVDTYGDNHPILDEYGDWMRHQDHPLSIEKTKEKQVELARMETVKGILLALIVIVLAIVAGLSKSSSY